MAPKTKGDAKPKADKKEKKPAPKKVEASKKESKDGKAPVKAVQKALKVSALLSGIEMNVYYGVLMLQVQKKVVKGAHGTRVKKVRTSVKFYRPKTLRLPRSE